MSTPKILHGVDMTPQSYEWQSVDRVSLDSLCGKPITELHGVVDELIKKHGEDAQLRVHSYESGGGWSMRADCAIPSTTHHELKVFKYLPVLTREQRQAELKEFAIKYDQAMRENTKRRYEELVAKGLIKTAPKGDKHAKRVQELHDRASRHDTKRKKK